MHQTQKEQASACSFCVLLSGGHSFPIDGVGDFALIDTGIYDLAALREPEHGAAQPRGATLRVDRNHGVVLRDIVGAVVRGAFHAVLQAHTLVEDTCAAGVLVTDEDGVDPQLPQAVEDPPILIPRTLEGGPDIAEVAVGVRDAVDMHVGGAVGVVFEEGVPEGGELDMEGKRELGIGVFAADLLGLFGVPIHLILPKADGDLGMSVGDGGLARGITAVGIQHEKDAGHAVALHDANGVIAVAREGSLLEKAMLGGLKACALEIGTQHAFAVVVSEHGGPRNAEALHKINEFLQNASVVVEFSVDEVARDEDQIG